MNPELVTLLIAGASGAVIGGIITVAVMSNLACRASVRASKQAWDSARIYYTRKRAER